MTTSWVRRAAHGIVALMVTMPVLPGTALASSYEVLQQLSIEADDDPRAALATAERLLASAAGDDARLWLLMGKARALNQLEDYPAFRAAMQEAQATRSRLHAIAPLQRLAFELEQIGAAVGRDPPKDLPARVQALRNDVRSQGDPRLACEVQQLDMTILFSASSYDAAWAAAEDVERCARGSGMAHLATSALSTMGAIIGHTGADGRQAKGAGVDATVYFQRALDALGKRPARFARSLVEWDMANALRQLKKLDLAVEHLQRARDLSEQLDDRAGVAAANITLASIRFDMGQYEAVLGPVNEAIAALKGHDEGTRLATAQVHKLRALARLRRAEVGAEIEVARALDLPTLQPVQREKLARAMAEALASQQAWARAYAELQRAEDLRKEAGEANDNTQVLRLQSRYDAVRRESENAELRHNTEMARAALERQQAEQRVLVAATLLLAVLAAAGIGLAGRLWWRRRAFATLALRDDLTGSPNRRAVTAYAQAQFEQARRLGVPLTVALLDLDHFKTVNDTHGHATGDDLLKAFVHAVQPALRGQDRMGRWGGEEWLLVMPGTRVDELPRLFERLRERFAEVQVPGMPTPHGQTFSMGGAALRADTASLSALIASADAQLYAAKRAGRDCVQVES